MMDPVDFANAVTDTLAHAEQWVGGYIGVMDPEHEGEIRAYLTGRGLIGAGGCLTRKGLVEARRAYIAVFDS